MDQVRIKTDHTAKVQFSKALEDSTTVLGLITQPTTDSILMSYSSHHKIPAILTGF